jgi:hypothetical protein
MSQDGSIANLCLEDAAVQCVDWRSRTSEHDGRSSCVCRRTNPMHWRALAYHSPLPPRKATANEILHQPMHRPPASSSLSLVHASLCTVTSNGTASLAPAGRSLLAACGIVSTRLTAKIFLSPIITKSGCVVLVFSDCIRYTHSTTPAGQ